MNCTLWQHCLCSFWRKYAAVSVIHSPIQSCQNYVASSFNPKDFKTGSWRTDKYEQILIRFYPNLTKLNHLKVYFFEVVNDKKIENQSNIINNFLKTYWAL